MKQLILGGARSGKSKYAEACARKNNEALAYIATAGRGDQEMSARIDAHQKSREGTWRVIEEPVELAAALKQADAPQTSVVVDCLTLWLSNCIINECFEREEGQLLEVLPTLTADIFFVSNEVGSGVVPLGELSRQFVDLSGFLHQKLAAYCEHVHLIVAGLPLQLK